MRGRAAHRVVAAAEVLDRREAIGGLGGKVLRRGAESRWRTDLAGEAPGRVARVELALRKRVDGERERVLGCRTLLDAVRLLGVPGAAAAFLEEGEGEGRG